MTHASVVSREFMRINLTLASLNDMDINMTVIENAFPTAPITEKVWTVLDPEFGADAGKQALFTRCIYGLKSDGASFRNHLAECMMHM
jgi:hypothetical protein